MIEMLTCRLCLKDSVLRNSHIVPEFLYGDLYNNKHQLLGIHGRGSKGCEIQQKGLREYLFCDDCERHFNELFEMPFRRTWIENCPLLNPWETEDVHWIQVDYKKFKLFHLSVLFRASVCNLPTFSEVSLGPHEERLRLMLLNNDAGPVNRYPIFGYAVIHHKTKRIVQIVSKAQANRFGGRRCYGLMYGGVEWWIGISSDTNYELQKVALRCDGQMPFTAIPWNEISVIQEASNALRKPGS
jgi:hypothetical protein